MKLLLRAALGVAAVSFLAFPALTRAQDSSHNLTAMDEFQLQLAADPQISPDGKKIVYLRRLADPMTDKRYANLWIINADGSDHHRQSPRFLAALVARQHPHRLPLRRRR